MKTHKILSRFAALLATASLAIAPIAAADQGRRGHSDRGDYSRHHDHRSSHRRDRDHRDYRRDRRNDRYDRRDRRDYRRANRNAYPYRDAYHHRDYRPRYTHRYATRGRAYGPYYRDHYRPRYHVGHHYRPHRRTVYISDYYRYGLYDPPRGYHWVRDRDNGDAILTSIATGAIIGLVIGALAYD